MYFDCRYQRNINEINLDNIEDWRNRIQREHDIEVMKRILSLIDTLEVKEINSTDAFNEKAEDYLNSLLYDWVYITNPDQMSCANIIPKKDFIEDFKNYMKGE